MLTDEIPIPERRGFRWRRAILALAVLLAVAGGIVWRTVYGAAPAQHYLTASVQRTDLAETVAATGPIVAPSSVPLSFGASGRLSEIDVKVGDAVAAGQVLARLDPTDLRIQLRQVQASLDAAEVTLNAERAGPLPSDVASAQAAVVSAQANLDLVKAGATSADLSTAEQAVQSAWSQVMTARDSRARLENGPSAEDVRNAQLAVTQARNGLTIAQISQNTVCDNRLSTADQCKQARLQTADAGAQVEIAENNLAKLTTPASGAAIAAATASVRAAENGYNAAVANYNTLKAGATQAQLAAAESQLASAQANLVKVQTPYTSAQIQSAQSAVDQAQAAVDLARASLDAATLTAPSAGIITAIDGAVGQYLAGGPGGGGGSSSGGTTGFITLTDLSSLQIQANVNEADVGRVKIGQPVTFTVDAYPGQAFRGRVAAVEPLGASSQSVVTYPVLISTDPTRARLLLGMTASVSITVDQRSNVLTVPSVAISFARAQAANQAGPAASSGPSALVVGSDGKATLQPIQTGFSDGQNTEVLSGLTEGQRVAIGLQGG